MNPSLPGAWRLGANPWYDVIMNTASASRFIHCAAQRIKPDRPGRARFIAALVVAGGAVLFTVASRLKPDPRNLGTHEQLGLIPCASRLLTGYPCPSCGMTTAFAHFVRGRPLQAFLTQPAGALFAFLVGVIMLAALTTLVTGRVWRINWLLLPPHWVAVSGVAILLLSWLYKLIRT